MPLTRKAREDKFSFYQIRHQQIVWVLYITEGFAAALAACIRRNTFHLNAQEMTVLEKMLAQEYKHVDSLRKLLGRKPRVKH